ncbi:MAG: LamG domain-containing protein [Lentisphaeria bacterium]|nr:LamG domain-containing protein [Lentisphaeria bacterium]
MKKTAVLLFCAAAFTLGATEKSAPVVEVEMVPAAIKDASANNLPVSITRGQFLTPVDGPEGKKALLFDAKKGLAFRKRAGGACIIVKGMNKFDFTKGFALSAWYKLAADAGDGFDLAATAKGSKGPGFRITYDYKTWRWLTGDGNSFKVLATAKGKTPIAKDVWTHIVLSFDGKTARIYLNGELAAETAPGEIFPLTNGEDFLTIGAYSRGYYYYFDGAIADMKIYNRPLETSEIIGEAQELDEL